jgi:NAD(P)-dependent dehydrogenase (short-subunit alcohol dehydrogenase family)
MNGTRTVIVTGASTGIGRATALHLAAAGFRVLAGVRREADGAALGPTVEPVLLDITDAGQVAAAVARLDGDPLAGLVNNAGIGVGGPIETIDLDDLRRQLEINLVAHVGVTQAALPHLRAAKGRIVNVGSIGGRMALPYMAPYTTSKAAMRSLTDSLRQELRQFGIRVALVEPGAIATEIWRKGGEQVDDLDGRLDPEGRRLYGAVLATMPKLLHRMSGQAIPPERVAKVIERALTADRPRAHYLVGPDAHVQAALAALGPRVTDRVLRLAMR